VAHGKSENQGVTVKVSVESERCQGHTLCAMIAPNSFELSDIDGSSSPVSEVVPADQEDAVREAAQSCPEQAIHIEE
jgi:ferredoxin